MKNSAIISIGIGVAIAAILAVVVPSGFYGAEPEDRAPAAVMAGEDRIKVFASFYPYYEFARNVAGESAVVEQYMPSGVEAHDWEPRALEIQSLKDADVFVYNGLGMEPYVDNLMESGEFEHVSFVKASESVELIKPDEEHDEHGHEEHDEHGHEEHDEHAEEFIGEIESAIEEFEHGHATGSQTLEQIEEILHQHEGDGHDHGEDTIETIEELLHEVEDGHFTPEQGIEEIHHFILGIEADEHDEAKHDEDEHDEAKHDEDEHDEHEDEHGHHHDFEFDPHIWLDPILVKQQVNNIRDGLIEADPQNKEQYEQNAMAYNAELDALDAKYRSSLASCSKDTFVPFHNAFTYLADRYELGIRPLGGLAPESESSAAEIAEFVDFVEEHDIKVIFAEELVDPRLAEVIADEAGAEVLLFSPLEALAQDEVGQDITYTDKMEQNLESLKVALECQ